MERNPVRQPPHPVLPQYYADAEQRQGRVNAMFDAAARHYDRIEGAMSLGLGRWYRREALTRAGLRDGMHLLDVGSGTGGIAAEAAALAGPQGCVIALDPSAGMLAQAQSRGIARAVRGLGESLPFADATFDVLSMGYALRHVSDLDRAFREYCRVLKPGGVALLLEITRPECRPAGALLKLYLKHVVPTITRIGRQSRAAAPVMSYYWDTIEQCVSPATIVGTLREAGFAQVERRVEFGILSAYTAAKA
jgi:demethylmenaquinone methyltransferase/2-methoxy-6-polyprenyl-1,4-benzoquinol methylase